MSAHVHTLKNTNHDAYVLTDKQALLLQPSCQCDLLFKAHACAFKILGSVECTVTVYCKQYKVQNTVHNCVAFRNKGQVRSPVKKRFSTK